MKSEAEARARAEAEAVALEKARGKAAEEARVRAEEEASKREWEAARQQPAADAPKREEEADRQAEPQFSRELRPEEAQSMARKNGEQLGIAALIAFLLLLAIYLFNMPKRQEPRSPSMPETTEKQATTQKSAPQTEKDPPLYVIVPSNQTMPAQFVYTVVKGDNLWNIAKRFTGNPHSYPRLVKDNGIATPDLIFPGQKIHVMRQAAAGAGPHGAVPSTDRSFPPASR